MTQPSQGYWLNVSNVADAIPTRPFGACASNRLTTADFACLFVRSLMAVTITLDIDYSAADRPGPASLLIPHTLFVFALRRNWTGLYEAARQASHHPAYACTSLAAGSVLSLLVAHGVSAVGGIAVSSKR